jgi:protein-S-isoprenylcysteine O-methyltransferase Ste14
MKWVAWLGGALFVASLATCAWWYFVTLGTASMSTGRDAIAVDVALVTIFALHHSLFARESVKARLRFIPHQLMRSTFVWMASALLIALVILWQPIGGEWYDHRGLAIVAHAFVQAAGVALIARSVAGIDALELAGIRQAGGAPSRFERLQIGGPYRFVRHPLYLGWILALFGAAHMTTDRLVFAAATTAYVALAVPWEERSLARTFGEEYARYRARVRWRIVPLVY